MPPTSGFLLAGINRDRIGVHRPSVIYPGRGAGQGEDSPFSPRSRVDGRAERIVCAPSREPGRPRRDAARNLAVVGARPLRDKRAAEFRVLKPMRDYWMVGCVPDEPCYHLGSGAIAQTVGAPLIGRPGPGGMSGRAGSVEE